MKTSILTPTFRASLQSDGTLELLVYEEIGENLWTGGGVTAKTVKQQLDQAGPYSRLAVRVNSPGGDAFEGIAIGNLLRAQGKPIDVFVDGIAASAASVVAMAGDTRTMGSNAMMMIHNAWCSCIGYADDMRKMADTLDKVSAAVAQTYVDRAGMSAADAKALMDAESWLSAQDCIDNGLATAIAEEDDGDDAAMALARSFKALGRLKNVPDVLRADAEDEAEPEAAEKKTKRVDGEDLEKSAFAYQGSEKTEDWKLPIRFSTEAKTKSHIRNAIARWISTDMPNADEKAKARTRIKAAAKEHGIDVDEDSLNRAGAVDLSAYEAELELIEHTAA